MIPTTKYSFFAMDMSLHEPKGFMTEPRSPIVLLGARV